ncbi:MAG: hypothetical protein ACI835_000562 [Planctomycetota bacterium]|jgi:hypothetical protein
MTGMARVIAEGLRETVQEGLTGLDQVSDTNSREPLAPGKWSRREMLGHLIDSASNNHQRFLRARRTDELVFDGYDQNRWVVDQCYAEAPWLELVSLWSNFNRHLARVIESTPEEDLVRPRAMHNLDQIAWETVPRTESVTLAYFMHDYVGHLRHHLKQIGIKL